MTNLIRVLTSKSRAKPNWRDKFRANQRAAKARKRIERGESEISEELRYFYGPKN
jgi:hypothetical protein